MTKYQKRISDALVDRIDILIEVPRVDYEKPSRDRMGETSETIREHVQVAREVQNKRFGGLTNIVCNADMRIAEDRKFCHLQDEGEVMSLSKYQSLMRASMAQLNLSACAYHRILKLARTIADLPRSEEFQSAHLAEALQYRPKIMMG